MVVEHREEVDKLHEYIQVIQQLLCLLCSKIPNHSSVQDLLWQSNFGPFCPIHQAALHLSLQHLPHRAPTEEEASVERDSWGAAARCRDETMQCAEHNAWHFWQ